MKRLLQDLLEQAVEALREDGSIAAEYASPLPVERARDPRHGHFASPVAMTLARAARCQPRELATQIVAHLPASSTIERVEIAGPGFINFFIARGAFQALARAIREAGSDYGRSRVGAGQRVQVEFVSSNPTGPLHVGHGRGAAYGDAVAALLAAAGYRVAREYYVNDAGRQMDILTLSVWLRYLQAAGVEIAFPANAYRGGYIREIAGNLRTQYADKLRTAPPEAGADPSPEAQIDELIAGMRRLLGEESYGQVREFALAAILADMRQDLAEFGVEFDHWFSERSLMTDGTLERTIERLRASGHLYERDGALWFRSTEFGDSKDRVVIRDNGVSTYFASDIAYHDNKFRRGFERLIDVWGADHHGYITRLKAALAALGHDPDHFEVLLVQFANLYRDGQRLSMSTRAGEFVTLRELRAEVGRDAARFFYVMRKSDQHLDFDLDLARSQSADNPVYYVQYAHARICSVMRQLLDKGYRWEPGAGEEHLELLVEPHELALLNTLSRYPEVVESAALAREPHQLAFYLRELANDYHTYYNTHTFLVEEAPLRDARLALNHAARQVLHNGLGLLGVSAPESM